MRIFYENVDITDDIELRDARYTDCAGGAADRLNFVFTDQDGKWGRWNPRANGKIRTVHNALDTGDMYVDAIRRAHGEFELGGVSIPQDGRTGNFGVWESIRLHTLLEAFAKKYGLVLKPYGVPDPFYRRLVQQGEPDFAWLAYRCMLERCAVKIMGDTLTVYYEPAFEQQKPGIELNIADYPGYAYEFMVHRQCAGCVVECGGVSAEFRVRGGVGRMIRVADLPALSIGEAERYAMGIARAQNKSAYRLRIPMDLTPNCAAGQTVLLHAADDQLDGIWFVDQAAHDFVTLRTVLNLRRPLEGY